MFTHRYNRADYEFDRAKREAEQKVKDTLREKFNESERTLNLLRTQGAVKLQQATDEEVESWAKANQISAT